MGKVELMIVALALSMDAFAVSITDGMTMIKLKKRHYVTIALFFGLFQALMPVLGYFTGQTFEAYIEKYAHWIALILLSFIGGNMIVEGIKCQKEKECKIRSFSFALVAVQALATSIDALMAGVAFAAVKAPLMYSALVVGITTSVVCLFGVFAGRKFGDIFKSKSELIGGAILVIIGLKVFLQH